MVFQDVTRINTLPIEAKGLYAYLASLSDVNDECYPTVDLICHELEISKDRFYKYMRILVAAGVVKKIQIKTEGCKFGRNVYKLTHEVYFSEKPYTENPDTESPTSEYKDANNKSINNNNINNNKDIDYQLIADMYNDTCVSFPHISKLSDARKKAIKARLRQYSVDDFKRLFQMAEASNFLKGQNNRNWSATFDWLIKDANMAKVLDGNYADKIPEHQEPEKGDRSIYKDHGEYEQLRRELEEEGVIQGTSETW